MNWLAVCLFACLQASSPHSIPEPVRKLDYFVGQWSFEWIVPDSPLGPGGKITGTETYQKILNGRFLESEIEANGAWGPFQGRALTGYKETEKVYTRYEVDSLGVATLKSGPMGGDAGGWYTIFWQSSPISKSGKVVRLKGTTLMYSPVSYRLRLQISVDGEPFQNFGSPWYRKHGPSAEPRP